MQSELSDVVSYISVKINIKDINLEKYISTENMLPNKGGIVLASSLPTTPKTNSFQVGDVLFSNIRTYFRKVWFATFDGGVSNDVLVLRSIDENILNNQYLYYLISNESFIKYTVTTAKGTKMPRGDKFAIMNYEFILPKIETQNKIANILSTLDAKIELNRKMNQTLEEMAQAIFKSWFVDFDPVYALANRGDKKLEIVASELGISKEVLELFPSEFKESELGMIPMGWEVEKLSQFGKIITGKTPSTKKTENYNGEYPFITIPDMHNNLYINSTVRTISDIGNKVQPKKLLPKDSLIVSCIATVGLVGINTKESHTNQQINSIVCEKRYLYYLYNLITGMKSKLEMFGSAGTTTLNVNKSTFESIEVIKPNDEILDKFLFIVESSYKKILKNTEEINNLQKVRDTLLPKLLSGEVVV